MNIEEEFKEVVPEEDTNSVEDEEISHSTNEDKIIPKKSKKKGIVISVVVISIILVSALLFADIDGDNLIGINELNNGTEIFNPDSDADGLSDGMEIELRTDPTSPDTDSDGIDDYQEVSVYNSNPNMTDTDMDGSSDLTEITEGTKIDDQDSDDDGFLDGADPEPLNSASPVLILNSVEDVVRSRGTYNYNTGVHLTVSPPLRVQVSYISSVSKSISCTIKSLSIGSINYHTYPVDISTSSSAQSSSSSIIINVQFSLADAIGDSIGNTIEGECKLVVEYGLSDKSVEVTIPSKYAVTWEKIDSTSLKFIDYDTLTTTSIFSEKRRNSFFDWRLNVPISFDAYATFVGFDPSSNSAEVDGHVWVARYFGSVDSEEDEFDYELAEIYMKLNLYKYSNTEPSVVHRTGTAIIVWTIDFDFDVETTGDSPDTGEFAELPNFYPNAIPTDLSFYVLEGKDTSVRIEVGEVDYELTDYYQTFSKANIVSSYDEDNVVGKGYYFSGLPFSQSDLQDAIIGNYLSLFEGALETNQRVEILMDVPGFMERVMW